MGRVTGKGECVDGLLVLLLCSEGEEGCGVVLVRVAGSNPAAAPGDVGDTDFIDAYVRHGIEPAFGAVVIIPQAEVWVVIGNRRPAVPRANDHAVVVQRGAPTIVGRGDVEPAAHRGVSFANEGRMVLHTKINAFVA